MKTIESFEFAETMINIVKSLIGKANFDKVETAIVVKINVGNTYGIKFNNVVYENIRTLSGNTFNINDTVKVMIPQNNYNQMFILGKLG